MGILVWSFGRWHESVAASVASNILRFFLLLYYTRAARADRLVCIGRIWISILGIDLEVLHGFTLHHRDTTSSMAGNVFLQLQSRGTFIPRKHMEYIYSAYSISARECEHYLYAFLSLCSAKLEFLQYCVICVSTVIKYAWTTSSRMNPNKFVLSWTHAIIRC